MFAEPLPAPSLVRPPAEALRASDAARVLGEVLGPMVGQGVILRRPRVVGMSARLDLDGRAVRVLQRVRAAYGASPVVLSLPGRDVVVVLSADDARVVLERSPEPYAPASWEKRGALGHFVPDGVLVSTGTEGAVRRAWNESALRPDLASHPAVAHLERVVAEEIEVLRSAASRVLAWSAFAPAWWRVVRRVVLGDAARDDEALTHELARLRADANWSWLHPRRDGLRRRFADRLAGYLADPQPGTVGAYAAAARPTDRLTDPVGQVPHWLFAFDAGGIAAARTLALLATHPEVERRAAAEAASGEVDRPYLRACVEDCLRLWPTTLVILRETTRRTTLGGRTLPSGATVALVSSFLHRDDETLADADRFVPDQWLGDAPPAGTLVPFSAGPAVCPGRSLVLEVAAAVLARLVEGSQWRLLRPAAGLGPDRPLPRGLSPYDLVLAHRPR